MCEAVLQVFDFVSLKRTSIKRGHVIHSCCVYACVCESACVYYIKLMNTEQMALK